jgi:GT2 family glycosyltransferase
MNVTTAGNDTISRPDVDVSVVMVSYNTRALTLEAIASVYRSLQDPDFRVEVIVVDNASADGSADAIEERFPGVMVIRSDENLGFGRGNNLGAARAAGRAIHFLNTDTIVHTGAIELLYRALFDRERRGVVGPFLENPDGSYQCSMISYPSVWRTFCDFFWLDQLLPRSPLFADEFMSHADPTVEREVDAIQGATMMIRRDLFGEIGGFDPDFFMYYEEVDLCRRVAINGYTSYYLPSARVTHLVNRSSEKAPPGWYYSVHRKSRMVYARKHLKPASRAAISAIMHTGYAVRIVLYHIVGLARPRFRTLGHRMLQSYLPFNRSLGQGNNAGR